MNEYCKIETLNKILPIFGAIVGNVIVPRYELRG